MEKYLKHLKGALNQLSIKSEPQPIGFYSLWNKDKMRWEERIYSNEAPEGVSLEYENHYHVQLSGRDLRKIVEEGYTINGYLIRQFKPSNIDENKQYDVVAEALPYSESELYYSSKDGFVFVHKKTIFCFDLLSEVR